VFPMRRFEWGGINDIDLVMMCDLLGKSYLKLVKPCPIDHGGLCPPTAAMVPHSRRCCTQQSTNMLVDCCMQRHREWGTMVATVGQLDHDMSTDVVVLL
jgi:hypothetical protein